MIWILPGIALAGVWFGFLWGRAYERLKITEMMKKGKG